MGVLQPPNRLSPARRPVLFGRELGVHALQQFQDVFERMPAIHHYGPVDVSEGYRRLSERARHYLGRLESKVTADDVRAFKQQGLLGTVEESADMLFEMYTLKAVENELITPQQVDQWVQQLDAARQDKVPFFVFVNRLARQMPEEQVRAFQDLVGLNAGRSRIFLALIATKFTLFKAKDEQFDMLAYTRPRMFMEAKELVETLPLISWQKAKLLFGSWAYTHVRGFPEAWFRNLTVRHAAGAMKLPVQYEDLMQYVFVKQLGRQELDYDQADLSYEDRKRIVKPFEMIYESAVVKDAQLRANPPADAKPASSLPS